MDNPKPPLALMKDKGRPYKKAKARSRLRGLGHGHVSNVTAFQVLTLTVTLSHYLRQTLAASIVNSKMYKTL